MLTVLFFSLETATLLWRLPLVSSHLSVYEISVLRVRGNCHQEVTDDQRLCCTLPRQKAVFRGDGFISALC